jgi:hypothetical protein
MKKGPARSRQPSVQPGFDIAGYALVPALVAALVAAPFTEW